MESQFDPADLWEESAHAEREYVEAAPSDQTVATVERNLGYRLPAFYVQLARSHNGGTLADCPSPDPSANHVGEQTVVVKTVGRILGILALVVLTVAITIDVRAAGSSIRVDTSKGCKRNPAVVDKCYWTKGTLKIWSGSPEVRISVAAPRRVLGVMDIEDPIMPDCLHKLLDLNNEIRGEFLVCPFEPERAGHMRMVCVDEVKSVVVKTWPRDDSTPGATVKKGPAWCPLGSGRRPQT